MRKGRELRKLALNRETLRHLGNNNLRAVVGASEAETDCGSACATVCPSDVCTQYPACDATGGVRTCNCSLYANCCSTLSPITE